MLYNNPAARLHQVLSLCRKHEKDCGSRLMLLGWRKILRISEREDDLAVLTKLLLVYRMPVQISDLIQRYPELPEPLYLGWKEELEQAFAAVRVQSQFDEFVKRIPKTLLIAIEFCARELESRSLETVVNDEDLIELTRLANELRKDLLAAELDNLLRFYLLDHTQAMLQALGDYSLAGSSALQTAADAAMGTVVTGRKIALASRESELGERFWSLVGKTSVALKTAKSDGEVGDGIFKTLGAKKAA